MKKSTSTILAAAVTGLLMGGTTGCKQTQGSTTSKSAEIEKHACKHLNSCRGQGGCGVEGKHSCRGNNACKGQGGCPTIEKHGCKGQNECAKQGGCGSGDQGCAGKNTCKGKGGCGVPVKKSA